VQCEFCFLLKAFDGVWVTVTERKGTEEARKLENKNLQQDCTGVKFPQRGDY
jgi:hypothetical protein